MLSVMGGSVELGVCELPAGVGGRCRGRAGARTLPPSQGSGLLAGCSGSPAAPRDAPAAHAALCWGEGLHIAAFLLPRVQPQYLLNFISLFPA